MGGNLAKAPLTAVLYGALLPFVAVLFPYSQGYMDTAGAFVMPKTGYAFLVAYGLWISIGMAIAFANVKGRGIGAALPLIITACGLGWGVPLIRQLMLGEPTGLVSTADTLFWLAAGCVTTILMTFLMMLLFKGEERPEPKPGAPAQPKYRIHVLGLIIRLLVLPVIFMVLYYLLWYFLLWRTESVREYFGQPELRNFMGEIIDILVNRGFTVVVTLIVGLAYALFSLPLLLQLPGKRLMFLVLNAVFYASSALLFLIPSPFMPDAVRMAHLLETGVLLVVYGAVSGILLHTALIREEVAAPAPAARPAAKPGQAARPAAQAAPAAKPAPVKK